MNTELIAKYHEYLALAGSDPMSYQAWKVRIHANQDPNRPHCQYECEHECTLIGHAHEAIRFLNQCLENGIVKSAVEANEKFPDFLMQLQKMHRLLRHRM